MGWKGGRQEGMAAACCVRRPWSWSPAKEGEPGSLPLPPSPSLSLSLHPRVFESGAGVRRFGGASGGFCCRAARTAFHRRTADCGMRIGMLRGMLGGLRSKFVGPAGSVCSMRPTAACDVLQRLRRGAAGSISYEIPCPALGRFFLRSAKADADKIDLRSGRSTISSRSSVVERSHGFCNDGSGV